MTNLFTEEEILKMRQDSRIEGRETAGYLRLFEEIMQFPVRIYDDRDTPDSQAGQPS